MANYCYKCGRPVRRNALFCGYCGTRIEEEPNIPKPGLINLTLPNVTDYDKRYDQSTIDDVFKAANQGDAAAIYELASRYRLGADGVDCNPDKAIRLYKWVLRKQNHRGAFYNIGYLLSDGVCGDEQAGECIQYYEAAIYLKSSYAANQMAILYEFGEFVPQNLEKAIMYYDMAIQFGNGNGTEWANKARAYEKLGKMDLARKTWEDALKHYDDCIQNGPAKDKAWNWTEKGHIYNHFNNTLMAKDCYERALFFGKSADAATHLGIIYEDGIPGKLDVDLKKAYYYYQLGYDSKDNEEDLPTYMLALFLFNEKAGKGQDFRAFNLFNELRDSGSNAGNVYLGFYYGMGIPGYVEVNSTLAFQLLDDVPLDDEAAALYYKGLIYLEKMNDETKAGHYLKLAAQKGDQRAIDLLNSMNKNDSSAIEFVNKSKAFLKSDNLTEAYNIILQGYQQYPDNLAIMRQLVEINSIILIGKSLSGNLKSKNKNLCYHALDLIRNLRANSYETAGLESIESNVYYCLGCILHQEKDIDNALKLLELSNVYDTPDAAIEIFDIHLENADRFINEFVKDALILKQSLNSRNWHTKSTKAVAYVALAMLYSDGAPGINIDINYAYECAQRSYELDPQVGQNQLAKYRKNMFGEIIYTR